MTTFLRDEKGAVTVDWVVLTALVIALWAIVFQMMSTSAQDLSDKTASYMSEMVS
ncbi:hypothetical protein [Pseudooceanicola sp. LIPI14-2-Ac024]|uniref:hypothetical protein n=1 Tax=Pseudooceanicola sp. LIPI14-2-Ac024 TaxID=3344875 RepID=UPI0035D119F2